MSNFFSKTIAFTNFLPKMHVSEFLKLPQCECGKYGLSRYFGKNFVKVTKYWLLSGLTKYFLVRVNRNFHSVVEIAHKL